MKKLLTLILAICMIAVCAIPVGAASFDLENIRFNYKLGEANAIFAFTGNSSSYFTLKVGDVIADADGMLTVSKNEGTDAKTLDIYDNDMLGDYKSSNYLYSFKFKTDFSTIVKFSSGSAYNAAKEVMHVEISQNTVSYYVDNEQNRNTVTVSDLSTTNWNTVDILFDNTEKKYYLWLNAAGNVLDAEPIIDGCDYYNSSFEQKAFRIWTGTIPEANSGNLTIKEMTVTPLEDIAFVPTVGTAGYAYEETFTGYADYDDTVEPWKTFEETVLKERSSSNAQECNPKDFDITQAGELKITYSDEKYHNWYFTNDTSYKAANPNANKLVIQVDIKSNNETTVNLGSYAASAVRVGFTDDGKSYSKSFIHSENIENAPYTTLTFLLEDSCYSVWMDDVKVVDKQTNNSTNNADSICFFCPGTSGHIIYVDNIRVFEAPTDFMYMYTFINSITDINDFISTDVNGITGFGVNGEIDASNVTITYSDSKGYTTNNNIIFPLFSDNAAVRAVVSSGDYVRAFLSTNEITFPSGYTAKGTATANGKTASIPVTLRNSSSARTDEVLVLAAAFDGDTLVATKKCAINDAKDAYEATFDTDITSYTIQGYIWEKGTLRPVK
ncbi:MAG: hypothetical protein IKB93_00985 [Clostridia bacterium]|nr:hypothetical protein [Clostridia bacterium]